MRGAARAPSTRRAHGRRYVPARPAVAQAGALRPATRANPCFDAYLDNEIAAFFVWLFPKSVPYPSTLDEVQCMRKAKARLCGAFARALFRTRTGDPFLTNAIQTAAGGSRWQQFRGSAAILGPLATRTFATRCAPSVP